MTNLMSRRTVLKGIGASIALPWLEAMGPFQAWASQAPGGNRVPTRMAFVYVPNGKNMADWTPKKEGTGFDLPAILEPLKPVTYRTLTGSVISSASSSRSSSQADTRSARLTPPAGN